MKKYPKSGVLLVCAAILIGLVLPSAAAEPEYDIQTVPDEIVAVASSEEEAQEAARISGLELVSYSQGIAVLRGEQAGQVLSDPQQDRFCFSPNLVYEMLETEPAATASELPQYHHREIDTRQAWRYTRGQDALVAVIDTGIRADHPEFAGRISPDSYNSHSEQIGMEFVEDTHGHGTHVSGIIAASAQDGTGTSGVAPEAELLVIKADRPSDHRFELASLLRGINYAVEKQADVINMSLGVPFYTGGTDAEREVLAAAAEQGVTVVCAAGNAGEAHACYPAAYPETVAVSATMEGFRFDDSYSNFGPEIDLAAPGTMICSTWNDGSYSTATGTSMASPVVAGTAALICALHPELTVQQVRQLLCSTARDSGFLGKDAQTGFGIVNAGVALSPAEQVVSVTYHSEIPEHAPVVTRLLPGSCAPEPQAPQRNGYIFGGWREASVDGNAFDFSIPVQQDVELYARWITNPEQTGSSLSGVIRSYDPSEACHIYLIRDDIVWYSTMIPSQHGSGILESGFLFEDVTPGCYRLEIVKKGQLTCTVENVEIGETPVDLSLAKGQPYQLIELIPGDLNQDGLITITDRNLVWNDANYLHSRSQARDVLADVNCDGSVDELDLELLKQYYHSDSQLDCTWQYQNEKGV